MAVCLQEKRQSERSLPPSPGRDGSGVGGVGGDYESPMQARVGACTCGLAEEETPWTQALQERSRRQTPARVTTV